MDEIELLKRQYLQLLEPKQMTLPSLVLMSMPHVQSRIYETMFQDGALLYSPPDPYKIRVLKQLVGSMEKAIADPEEDEISDDLTAYLAQLMSEPQVPSMVAAQQRQYVTYTLPEFAPIALTVTTLEARAVLASSGTTGLRTWEAALFLGTFLSTTEGRSLVKDRTIVELGAGTGFLSILCANHLGAKYVLATDGSGEVINDLSLNLFLNGLEGNSLVHTAVLKWGHALTDSVFADRDCIRQFDLILGADLNLSPDMPNQILDTLYSGQLADPITSHHQNEQNPASQESYGMTSPPNLEGIQQNDTDNESYEPSRGENRPHDSDHELNSEGELRRRPGHAIRIRMSHDSDNEMDSDGFLRPIRNSHHDQHKLDRPTKGSNSDLDDYIGTWTRFGRGRASGGSDGNGRSFYDARTDESDDSYSYVAKRALG